jgi:hypothetical protein
MTKKIMPDEMSIKSICLDCKNYDRKGGVCKGTNPFVKSGDKSYLLLVDKASCYGFDKA